MRKSFLSILIVLLFQTNIIAQEDIIEVHGTVTDADSAIPIPGANVIQKGTTNGVVTNFDGEYTIEVPANAILVFSYLGYADEEVEVDGDEEIHVSLEPETSALEEVVVVGYGTQKKKNLTGAPFPQ